MADHNSYLSNNLTNTKPIYLANNGASIHFFEDTVFINQNFPKSVVNITMFLITVTIVAVVNMMVLLWVKVKDRVLIDKMVTMDCVANIMMVGIFFLAFPCRVWSNRFLCAGITLFRVFTATINR